MENELLTSLEKSALLSLPEGFLEEILARSAESPSDQAVPPILDAVVSSFGARFGLLFTKEDKRRRHLVGRWTDGKSIGRPDKLYQARYAEQVLQTREPLLIPNFDGKDSWWAGFPMEVHGKLLGGVFLEGKGPAYGAGEALSHSRKFAFGLSAALALDDLREANGRLREEIARLQGDQCLPLPGCPPAVRAIVEYALAGNPQPASFSSLHSRFPEIVGQSPAIRGVLQSILVAARSDISILIEGESGTGKELVAIAIHRSSSRGNNPFVCENCGALPENLVESEFFGHERGAFTGADRQKAGLFERARGGTVFLDEIGEMDLPTQRKLLRVVQEKEVRRVGGQETVPVDFRVLSATNRVLEEMVSSGKFREDLYYRLNVATIAMPALRERAADIPLLVEHFNLLFAAELGREPMELTPGALAALGNYAWPGNVRELRNEILRLSTTEKTRIDADLLSRRILQGSSTMDKGQSPPSSERKPLLEIEREMLGGIILEALRTAKGNRAEAARRLGITRSALYRRLLRYRLIAPGK